LRNLKTNREPQNILFSSSFRDSTYTDADNYADDEYNGKSIEVKLNQETCIIKEPFLGQGAATANFEGESDDSKEENQCGNTAFYTGMAQPNSLR